MEIIIYYNSKTGFTKKYASWIADELKCNIFPFTDFAKSAVSNNSIIIFGSRIHAGKIEYLNKVKACFSDKQNIIIFATGATPLSETSTIEKIWANNFTDYEIKTIPHFYMQSGLNYEKMGFIDQIMMKTLKKIIGIKKNKNKAEKRLEQAIKESHDVSSRENIKPLIDFIRNKYSIK